MSNAKNLSALSLKSWRGLGLAAIALFGLLAPPATAANDDGEEKADSNVTIARAPADAKFTIASTGALSITIPRTPTSSTGTQLLIVNSSDYVIWSAPLNRAGGALTAKIDAEAAEALLVASAVKVAYPGAGADGKDLQVRFIRDQFQSQIGSVAGLVGSDALFYEAPTAPAPLEAPASLNDRAVASSYAMAARRYDEELTAYYHRLIASHASAVSLWTDLKTAGRLGDWSASAISAQDRLFTALAKKKDAVASQKSANRKQANALINQWNSANGGDEPINLEFRDAS